MKKRTITLLAYGLALMFLMYNCKKKDVEDPLAPDQNLVDQINAITLPNVTLVKPAEVVSTDSKIEISEKAGILNSDIGSLGTSGAVPTRLRASAAEVTTTLTSAEAATMANVTPEMVSAVTAGGAIPANLKAILDKAMGNASLAAYIPKTTLPTVEGKEVKGARTGASEAIEQVEAVQLSDVCLAAAEAAFQTVKTKLDASKATLTTSVATQYAADLLAATTAQTACPTAIPAKYLALRTEAETLAKSLAIILDGNQAALGTDYISAKALVFIELFEYYIALGTLQAADTQACTVKGAAATTNAEEARDANTDAVEAAYKTVIDAANKLKGELAESCHNQGGGQ